MNATRAAAIQPSDARRGRHCIALLGGRRLLKKKQPTGPDARAAGRLVAEQTKPLCAAVASRAFESRPETIVLEDPHPNANLVFDAVVGEPDARRGRIALDAP